MRITFFVGNGFDISCKIQSSYSEFYKWYCKQEASEFEHVNVFRKTIDEDIKAGKKNWADFEEALGQYTKNFTKATVQQFYDCYEDASKKLMEYLSQQIDRFDDNLLSDAELQRLKKGLVEFYYELTPREKNSIKELLDSRISENRVMTFVSFNYTDILDRCISSFIDKPLDVWRDAMQRQYSFTINFPVIHAHGLLERHPVFGVNDESQIANKELLSIPEFANLMIKPKCVEELGEFWHDDIKKVINDSTIICILGMSMGITDTLWFEKIIRWLQNDNSKHLILFWHTDDPSDNRSNMRFFENRRLAKAKITDYSDCTREQINELDKRIHVVENTEHVLQVNLNKKADNALLSEGNENDKNV